VNNPLLIFAATLLVLWLSTHLGDFLRRKNSLEDDGRKDLGVVLAATLTLLGLIIGFTFSMAVSRYDQRKNYEEAEANAIGTEYVRADLLPPDDAKKERELLRNYLDQRILFYTTRNADQLVQIDSQTAQLQGQMWSVVQTNAMAHQTPIVALTVVGMNDVLNSEGYTQAAWWNRIPMAAWALLMVIAVGCTLLAGYSAHRKRSLLFLVLPVAVSISFFLIADIDSTRGGVIRVLPQNLERLSIALHGQ
jgi:hypothetical protein